MKPPTQISDLAETAREALDAIADTDTVIPGAGDREALEIAMTTLNEITTTLLPAARWRVHHLDTLLEKSGR